jgi:activator of HSP90 ATPase
MRRTVLRHEIREDEMNDRTHQQGPAHFTTRREAIVGVAVTFGGLSLASTALSAGAEEDVSHSAESIHQEAVFKASRKRVYDALTDTAQFDKVIQLSGAMKSMALGSKPTDISREAGGAFTLFGGHIMGRQIELVPDERIVQAWRVESWARGIYSIAKFELTEQRSGTKIIFDHVGFPQGMGEHLAAGWKAHYWEPLDKLLT